jgi:hypothetical protein
MSQSAHLLFQDRRSRPPATRERLPSHRARWQPRDQKPLLFVNGVRTGPFFQKAGDGRGKGKRKARGKDRRGAGEGARAKKGERARHEPSQRLLALQKIVRVAQAIRFPSTAQIRSIIDFHLSPYFYPEHLPNQTTSFPQNIPAFSSAAERAHQHLRIDPAP